MLLVAFVYVPHGTVPESSRGRAVQGGAMSLTIREQSEQLQAASAAQLPADVVEVFSRNSQQLGARGIPAGTVKVGDTLPSFTLRNAVGEPVSLDNLVATGPAVLVFYRGGCCRSWVLGAPPCPLSAPRAPTSHCPPPRGRL